MSQDFSGRGWAADSLGSTGCQPVLPRQAVRGRGQRPQHQSVLAVVGYQLSTISYPPSPRLRRTGSAFGNHGRGCGVGRGLGVGLIGGELGVGVALGLGVTVGVGVSVGVGVGDWSDTKGTITSTVIGDPCLKKPIVAWSRTGAAVESNRKLYNVPQRIAFAFGFCAKVSVLQVTDEPTFSTIHGVLLYPASPTVPSCGHPGCCGGAWKSMLLTGAGSDPKETWKDWMARSRFMLKRAYS
jgi:hypothetical protein